MSSSDRVPPTPIIPFSTSQSNKQSLSTFFDSNNFSIECINGGDAKIEEKECTEQAEVDEQPATYRDEEFDSSEEVMAEETQDATPVVDSSLIENEETKVKTRVEVGSSSTADGVENRHSNNSAMSIASSSRRKRFHPKRQPIKIDRAPSETADEPPSIVDARYDCEIPASKEKTADEDGMFEAEENQSSRDLSPFPAIGRACTPPVSSAVSSLIGSNSNGPCPLNGSPNKQRELFELQQRMYAAFNQQRQQRAVNNVETDETRALTAAVMQIFRQFTQSLSEEFSNSLRRLETESYAPEIERISAQHVQQAQQLRQQKEQQIQQEWRQQHARMTAAAFGMPPNLGSGSIFNSLSLPPYATNPNNLIALAAASNQQNPLSSLASSLANPTTVSNGNPTSAANGSSKLAQVSSSGIFPNSLSSFPPFNGFGNQSLVGSSLRSDDGSPRKKRSKVTDSVRGPRASAVRDTDHSLPTSNRSSPQPSAYFPPTMVSHPMFNNAGFKLDNSGRSPGNSDMSDYDGDSTYMDSGSGFSATLTHVHLRKAKLMFFYTRYPNSAVLKSYFPDINFNKHNTAQLVKWFSNFREFYYMQMEKYAKQALAEGIQDANEISVTTDSEIYRTLNQHYNRNNFITPPEALPRVIEETLKEFFRALRDGRDSEPSWKKAIYKVINQLDEQIPECFKSPQFMAQLEGTQQ